MRDADMKQMDALRAQLEAVTRERDERYDCRGGPGTTAPACGGCVTCLHRVIEATKRERDGAFAQLDEAVSLAHESRVETVRARADAARLREALEDAVELISHGDFRNGNEHAGVDEGEVLTGRWIARFRAALASTPRAEPPLRAKAERWLNDGPEEPGGTLAFHAAPSAEPTPRDMRVAEAVREACVETADASDEASRRVAGDLRDLDLAAVVAKAVKP